MPSRLRERQFGTREDRDAFFHSMRATHKDVIRGTEQEDGLMVWWVMYGERKTDEPNSIIEAINKKIEQDRAVQVITLEPPATPATTAPADSTIAVSAEGDTNVLSEASETQAVSGEAAVQDPSPR